MSTVLLCDWTTVRAGGPTSIAQGETDWVDLGDYIDATFWVDCREVSGSGAQLLLETSPNKDESLFQPVTPPITLAANGTPTTVRSVIGASTVPLARWLRWRLTGPGGGFDATFRIGMTGTPFSYFVPTQLAGCVLWLRADLGVTIATSPAISAWNDQSGVGTPNNFSQGTSANQPTLVTSGTGTINGLPAIKFSNSASVQYLQCSAGNIYGQTNSLFFVWFQSATGIEQFVDGASGSSNRQQLLTPVGSTTSLQLNAGTSTQSVTVGSYAVPNIIEVDWNGASTQVVQNGGAPVTVGSTPGANSWGVGTIGATQTGTTGVNASFAEFVAFSKILSASDRTRLTRYLGGRYGISVP
jgi:hypothetical protein